MELNKITPLCKLAYKYGTDKCPQIKHSYTPFYFKLFNKRRFEIKKVLELGIGATRANKHFPENKYRMGHKEYLSRGASLYMWREFFPNAQIYGADINPDTIFQDDRILTYLCNEKNEEDLVELIKKTGSDLDFVLDDASHHTDDQLFAAKTLLPLIGKDTTYIIEDASHTQLIRNKLKKIGSFRYQVPGIYRIWKGGMILVINKNNHGE